LVGLTTLKSFEGKTLSDILRIPGIGECSMVELLATIDLALLFGSESIDGSGLTSMQNSPFSTMSLAYYCCRLLDHQVPWSESKLLARQLHEIRIHGIHAQEMLLEDELSELGSILVGRSEPVIDYLGCPVSHFKAIASGARPSRKAASCIACQSSSGSSSVKLLLMGYLLEAFYHDREARATLGQFQCERIGAFRPENGAGEEGQRRCISRTQASGERADT
jgi:hypothetical protein